MDIRRPLAVVTILASAALLLTGCGARADRNTPAGTEVRSIEVDGVERGYRVHVPEQLGDDPALVVMMHGGLGSAEQAEGAYLWDDRADAAGFVVVYPDGENRTWNAGDCCGQAAREDVDDVAFVTALVADLQREFGISSDRTFGTGMSNGAMMTYRMACETDVFAAIAPVAGTVVVACDDPSPVSLLHVHGLDDQKVRMDGAQGDGPGRVDGMPVDDAVDLWHAADDCEQSQVSTEGSVTTATSACADGRTVTLVTIAGAGHQWPSSIAREGAVDAPSDALDATALIWQFFDAA